MGARLPLLLRPARPPLLRRLPHAGVQPQAQDAPARKGHGSFFSGIIRKKLKYKNLGNNTFRLLENVLKDAKKEGFQFIGITKYGNKYLKL